VTPTDTLGAGDAFISGFLVSYIEASRDRSVEPAAALKTALDKGAAFAAEICQVQGAFGHGMRY
jgi:fructoselysine 6-kinase